jgi:transposase
VFVDESGFYLLPGLVRTYSPAGITPVVYEWQTRDHLSVMAGLTRRGRLFTLVRDEALRAADSAGFLAHLLRHWGRKLLVVWDGSAIHRGQEVRDLLASRPLGRRVWLERLPGYAPELNPVEGLWQHLKNAELRNVVCADAEQLREELRSAVARVRHRPSLLKSFFAGAGLL